jgi:site-specific recombinase XerD
MSTALAVLPDIEKLERLVLDTLHSENSRRAYRRALRDFFSWYQQTRPGPVSKAVVQQYVASLEAAQKTSATINQSLAAIRKLMREAADNGCLDPHTAAAVGRVKALPMRGVRAGNWLTAEQAWQLLCAPDTETLKGKRDRALLAVLIGCGLRRQELSNLQLSDLDQRDGRWVVPELKGKGNRIRLVPVPAWVKEALDLWTTSGNIGERKIFRSVTKSGDVGESLSVKAIWKIVLGYAQRVGIRRLGPHDLRRTCARLCDAAGEDLAQIQFLLGHSSAEVTRKYIGSGQNIKNAANDSILQEYRTTR